MTPHDVPGFDVPRKLVEDIVDIFMRGTGAVPAEPNQPEATADVVPLQARPAAADSTRHAA
jgi:hypothetical protein